MTLDEEITKLDLIASDAFEGGDANEFKQLAEWLRELRHLRNITEYLKDMVTCFEFMDSMHYNEDIIEWAESELSVDMQEVNADEDSN